MSVYAGPETTSSNLVFCIDFSNPRSVNTTTLSVTDLGPRNITVTLTNASNNTVTIANGYAQFSPAGQQIQSTYYNISNTYFNDIRNEITMELCVWSANVPDGGSRLVSTRTTETGSPIGYSISNTGIGVEINSGGVWRTTSYGITNGTNNWIHVMQTTSNTNNVVITYVNGANVGAMAIPGTLANGNGFLIGRGFYGGDRYPVGRVSYLKVYDRVLSPGEVKQNFNAMRARFGI
jgi:hypothetical protein